VARPALESPHAPFPPRRVTAWRGKLIGLLLGLLTRRWQLVLLGLALGHLYDMGVFSRRGDAAAPPAAPPGDRDPYAVLGIAATASDEEVEQAYRRSMSEFHPDRVSQSAAEIRELAERRTREANAAYDAIKRQRGR
jgi:hypothetical protein